MRLNTEYEDDRDGGNVATPATTTPATTTPTTSVPNLADQLRGQWGGDWNISGVDRAQELAGILQGRGITSLDNLTMGTGRQRTYGGGYALNEGGEEAPSTTDNLGQYIDFGGTQIGNFGDRGAGNYQDIIGGGPGDNEFGWSSAGHGAVGYSAVKDASGKVQIVPNWNSSSDADDIRPILMGLATVLTAGAAGGAFAGAGAAGAGAGAAGAGTAAGVGAAEAGLAGLGELGINTALSPSFFTAPSLTTVGQNALINGAITEARGGNFLEGAALGAVSGGLSGFTPAAGLGITDPLIGGAVNAASRGALTTAVSGGGIEDILKAGLTSGAGDYINTGLVKGLNNALPKIDGSPFVSGVGNSISDAITGIGLPESVGEYASKLVPNVVTGAARGALQGDVLGGVSSAVLGQVVQDTTSQLNLSPTQGRAVASYLITGDEKALAISLGTSLAKQAINAATAVTPAAEPTQTTSLSPIDGYDYDGAVTPAAEEPAAQQVEITAPKPAFDLDEFLASVPQSLAADTLFGPISLEPEPPAAEQQVEITAPKPAFDLDDFLASVPQSLAADTPFGPISLEPEPPAAEQQVEITAPKPAFDLDEFLASVPQSLAADTPFGPISLEPEPPAAEQQVEITAPKPAFDYTSGGYDSDVNYGDPIGSDDIGVGGAIADQTPAAEQVVITGQKPKPIDDELSLPEYGYSIPELPFLEPPKVDVEEKLAPPLVTPPKAVPKGLDIGALLSILGGGGQQQEPVLSQVLAQMPEFNVEEQLSPMLAEQRRAKRTARLSPQEQQLADLIEELKSRG